jgi:hypothetical protein
MPGIRYDDGGEGHQEHAINSPRFCGSGVLPLQLGPIRRRMTTFGMRSSNLPNSTVLICQDLVDWSNSRTSGGAFRGGARLLVRRDNFRCRLFRSKIGFATIYPTQNICSHQEAARFFFTAFSV